MKKIWKEVLYQILSLVLPLVFNHYLEKILTAKLKTSDVVKDVTPK